MPLALLIAVFIAMPPQLNFLGLPIETIISTYQVEESVLSRMPRVENWYLPIPM